MTAFAAPLTIEGQPSSGLALDQDSDSGAPLASIYLGMGQQYLKIDISRPYAQLIGTVARIETVLQSPGFVTRTSSVSLPFGTAEDQTLTALQAWEEDITSDAGMTETHQFVAERFDLDQVGEWRLGLKFIFDDGAEVGTWRTTRLAVSDGFYSPLEGLPT